ncbi:MAG: hypothetical protein CVV00_00360 [Firmicutes bacterium HGW-Firmicutes-5]|nr:MAG: hypothetical protein CVV00_00360 [Firmicutes bacterium HGW-Firmicutes-5]
MRKKILSWMIVFSIIISTVGGNTILAVPTIDGVTGTNVNYDELEGTPVLAQPDLIIGSDKEFDENSYIEYSITDSDQYDQIGIQEVADAGLISTGNDVISVFEGIVFKGNGSTYDAIASVDSVKNGQDGSNLKIIFERALPNANFLDGTTNTNLGTNDLAGWTIQNGIFNLTEAGLNQRSLSREYDSITPGDPVTIVGPGNSYTYTTGFNYGSGIDDTDSPTSYGNDGYAWPRESREGPSSLSTTVQIATDEGGTGGKSLALSSSGQVTANAPRPETVYGSAFGPVVISEPFLATADENLSLDWKARFDADHYEVYGYLVETMMTEATGDDVYHLIFYGRGENQAWTTATSTIPVTGEYRFMFINGTYDKTGGRAVGSRLWIDNIKVYGSKYSPAVAQAISVLVTYQNTTKDPEDTRNLMIKVVDEDGEGAAVTASSTITITNQFDHPPIITTTGNHPNFSNDANKDGDLYASTDATTVEAADLFDKLTLTVSGLLDGNDEILVIDGTQLPLANGGTGITGANSINYAVSEVGGIATVELTDIGLTDAAMNTLINNMSYDNLAELPSIGQRVVTITYVQDDGATGGANENETVLNLVSTVKVSNVVSDLSAEGRTVTTADLSWTAPVGATSITVQQSTNGGSTWVSSTTSGSVANNASDATVTGLSGNLSYMFRILVAGGDHHGISNIDGITGMSSTTLITSDRYQIANGQTANETIDGVPEGTSIADFLTELTKGHIAQVWDDSMVHNPVEEGDTLIVTAPDGVALTTYTISLTTDAPINIAAISGVIAPVRRATPVTTITETNQYTGTVSWSPVHDSFEASTVYTASITLTPKAGYTLVGVGANFFTVAGVSTPATNLAHEGVISAVFAATASSSGGGGGSLTPTPDQETLKVIVNGIEENAGTEIKSTEDGKSTVTVEVDNEIIEDKIDEAINNNLAGIENLIQVTVADTQSDVVKVELTGDVIKKLEDNNFKVSVKRDNIEYIIPAEEFTISKVADNLGILEKDLYDIKIEVKIAKLDDKTVEKYNEVAKANGAELVFPPVEFQIIAKTTKTDGTTSEVAINKFSNYVERIMEIPADVDLSMITTGIVFNPDGTYSHVPTDVLQKDGKWYAKLNSLTNSNYSVIWNPVTVKSVDNHWSKEAVNDMASRLIIFNPESFEPNKAITRADFAEYIVRALGLYRVGSTHENIFKDVSTSGDRTLAILIANEYEIVTGYPDGTFRTDQKISREEAMAMYQRAMAVTNLVGIDQNNYQNYTDYGQVGSWATTYVKEVLAAHVFKGTTTTTISPKSDLTYGEAAQAIKNLLIESKLINK